MLDSLRSRLARWIAPEARGGDGSWGGGFHGGYAFPTLAGPPINERSALGVAAVWAAVNCYVNTIGSLDLYIASTDKRGGRRPAPDHPAYDIIRRRPNPMSTSVRFRQALVGHAITRGNGYAGITWDSKGRRPVRLDLLDPRETNPCCEGGKVVYRQDHGPDLPAEDVIHIAMFGWDGVQGYSPITVARETLGVAAAQRDYQAGLFGNSAAAQGHLEVAGRLDAKKKQELRDDWNRLHQGADNAGNVGILDSGMKWVQTNFSPQDAQMIMGANFSVAEVARIFNLPQHKLNLLENTSFATVEEMNIDYYQTSIMPWLVAIEQELDNKLLGKIERQSYFVTHDARTLLRGNSAAQLAQDQVDLGTGVRSINEIRIGRGLEPLDEEQANYHWVQSISNLQPIEMMGDGPDPGPTNERYPPEDEPVGAE